MIRQTSRKIAASLILMLAFAIPSHAYLVDGLLNDWGVTPFSDWSPNSLTADWVGGKAENNNGGWNNTTGLNGFGGETFDVEAMYFDDFETDIYFAIITSFPQEGVDAYGTHFNTGDLGLDLYPGGSYGYEYGVKCGINGFGTLSYLPTWTLPDGNQGWTANAPSEFLGGTSLGTISLIYSNLGVFTNDNGTINDYSTYLIEGKIAKSDLEVGAMNIGQQVKLHWTMSCGNDAVDLQGDVDNPVPEPTTMVLMGAGLVGISLRKRFSKRSI